jgi:hypothetical protein
MLREEMSNTSSRLVAVYDFQIAPLNFDIITCLIAAEMDRIHLGLEEIQLVIVGSNNRHSDFCIGTLSNEMRYWRERKIITEALTLMPSCRSYRIFGSREEAEAFLSDKTHVYPEGYTVDRPVRPHGISLLIHRFLADYVGTELPILQPSRFGKEMARKWIALNCDNRKLITVTLREYGREEKRNVSLKDWGQFVNRIDHEKYAILLFRDFDMIQDLMPSQFANCLICNEAMFSLDLRQGLYDAAYLNLGINGGSMALPRHSNQPYLMLKPTVGDTRRTGSALWRWRALGIDIGDQYPWRSPFQRIIWRDDTHIFIMKSMHFMVQMIENNKYSDQRITEFKRNNKQKWKQEEIFFGNTQKTIAEGLYFEAEKMLKMLIHFEAKDKYLDALLAILFCSGKLKATQLQAFMQNGLTDCSAAKKIAARLLLQDGEYERAELLVRQTNATKGLIIEQEFLPSWIVSLQNNRAPQPKVNRGMSKVVFDYSEHSVLFFECDCSFNMHIGRVGDFPLKEIKRTITSLTSKENYFYCPNCLEEYCIQ